MRSEAKIKDQNLILQDKLADAQDEIKQLRQYLRDIFEQQEENIVALSFDKDSEKKTAGILSETSVKGGAAATEATGSVTGNTSMHAIPQRKQSSTTEELLMKNSKKVSQKRDLRAVSNIH